jgi:hypothetical protein
VNHVHTAGGGTEAVATDDTVCLPTGYCLAAFDDSLLEVFLQTII